MNRRSKCILIMFLFLIQINRVHALSVSDNSITLLKGNNETIELYADNLENATDLEFTLVFSSYDIPAYFKVNSKFIDKNPNGVKHNIVFDQVQNGKVLLGEINISAKENTNVNGGNVSIRAGAVKTRLGESIVLNNQTINITIGQEELVNKEQQNNNLLEKIESKIVNIELKEDVFEYTVNINKDILELDLKAVAKNNDTEIEISNQKISELENGKIIITAKNGDIKQEYMIIVKEIKEVEKVLIDEQVFELNDSYKSKWIIFILGFVVLFMLGFVLNKRR